MKDKFEIKNCFEFVCPLKWDNLEKTDNNDIRFCGSCEKQVFKASDLDSFSRLANENKCVAYIGNEGVPTIMGETIPPVSVDYKPGSLSSVSELISKKSLD